MNRSVTIASYEGSQRTGSFMTATVETVSWAIFLRLSQGSIYSFDKETGHEIHPSKNIEWRIDPDDLRLIKEISALPSRPVSLAHSLAIVMQNMACTETITRPCDAQYPDRPESWCQNCRMKVAAEFLKKSL